MSNWMKIVEVVIFNKLRCPKKVIKDNVIKIKNW